MKLKDFIKSVRAERNGGKVDVITAVKNALTRKAVTLMSSTEYERRFYGEPGFRQKVDKLFAVDR